MINSRFLPFTEFDKSSRYSYIGPTVPSNVLLSYLALLFIVLVMVRVGFSGVELYYDISDPVLREEVFSVSSFLDHIDSMQIATFDISSLLVPVPDVPVLESIVDFINILWSTLLVLFQSLANGLGLLYGIISWFF